MSVVGKLLDFKNEEIKMSLCLGQEHSNPFGNGPQPLFWPDSPSAGLKVTVNCISN
jgi:hypothetical protein